jgi:hypothetical protein
MANTTISALPSATTPLAGTEVVPIVQGGVTKKVAVSNIGGGSGTVTSVSVVSANGLAGSVATASTTPAITLSTTVSGVVKGSGGALTAATAGTDYLVPPSGTSILKAGGGGALANAVAGSDYQAPITLTTSGTSGAATFISNTLNIPQYSSGGGSGTVTSVGLSAPAFLSVTGSPVTTSGTLALSYSGTALPVANGGTGQITANAALNGLLPSQTSQSGKVLSTDGTNTSWIAAGGTGTVTSVGMSVPAFLSVTGSPVTASGTLAVSLSGTALPVANGGTGATTATSAFDGLAPTQTGNSGKYLTTNGTTTSWATVSGTGTVTSVAQSFTGGIVSVSGSPITTSGTLALTVAGTSGGVPYFSSGTTWATSAALAANALVVGGGAGAAPATVTTGTGVVTALGVNTGNAGAFVVNGGALGTPASGTVTNLTGTASININGTVGASTPTTGVFTTATVRSTAVQDFVALQGRAGGTNSYGVTITPTTLTASQTLTLPDASGTILQSGTTVTVGQGGTGTSTLTGIVKGNGTSAFTAATAGTDYSAGTSALATGIVKSTTTTGALSIAVANTDYQSPITLTTTGTSGAATFVGNTLNIPQYTGGGSSGPILESYQTISSNYSITSGSNGFSIGPVTVATGVAVTVPTGQAWVVAVY